MRMINKVLTRVVPWTIMLSMISGTAVAGIEEHSPVPTQEEWDLLMLDDEFWDGVDEARDQSSEGNPATSPYSTEGMIQDDLSRTVAEQPAQALGLPGKNFTTFDPDNPFDESLLEHAELKWRLATLGIEYLSEEELENWKEEAADNAVEETTTGNGSRAGGDISTANASATAAEASQDEDSESDGEEDETGEKEGTLTSSDPDGYDASEGGGCQTGYGAIFPMFLLLCLLFISQRKSNKVLR